MFQRFILTVVFAGIFAHSISCKGENHQDMRIYLRDSLPGKWSYVPERTMEMPMESNGWWKRFNDPALDTLIAIGMDNNYNLAMALRRTQIARNAVGQARARWMPTINASAGWTKLRDSGMTGPLPVLLQE